MKNLIQKLTALLIATLFTITLFAQDKENRTVNNFSSINVSSGIDLYITQGDAIDLKVICDKSELHRLITEVEGNTLKIYMKGNNNWSWANNNAPKVYVTFKQISEINANGGSDVYGQNTISAESLLIKSSGGADIYADIKTDELKINSSGGSDIKIKGTTNTLTASASGGSDINARELKAQKVKVNSSGGADAVVWAEKEIIANASGGSDIDYYGNPEIKQLSESGAGDIHAR